jgi:hypothetical protein
MADEQPTEEPPAYEQLANEQLANEQHAHEQNAQGEPAAYDKEPAFEASAQEQASDEQPRASEDLHPDLPQGLFAQEDLLRAHRLHQVPRPHAYQAPEDLHPPTKARLE